MPFLFCLPVSAATLRTLDGRTLEGEVKLEPTGQISVTPTKGKPETLNLADVLHATFRNAVPTPPADAARAQPAAAIIQTENCKLPTPWQATDVGDLTDAGYARYKNGDFSIKSAGANVGRAADAFCFVNQSIGADAEIAARVISVGDPREVAAGLMVRCSPDPDAAYAALFVAGNELRFLHRARRGDPTEGGSVGERRYSIPVHLKLTRRANTVTAFASRDGETWEQLGSEILPADTRTAIAGMAACGRGDRQLGAHFDKVRLISIAAVSAPAALSVTESPRATKPGLMLKSGTLLAGALVHKADDASVTYTSAGREQTVSLVNLARVVFRELSPEQAARIPEKRPGVLLKEGDFVEGQFKGIDKQGRVLLSSVLFGLAKFEQRDKAVALVLNDVDPAAPQMVLRTVDGSVYVAKSVAFDKERLVIEDPVAGPLTVNRADVTELSAGAGRMESLATIKPRKVDGPAGGPDSLSIDSTGVGLPMTVAGVTCDRGLTLTAGAAATWDLAGKYRTLTFKCGVPTGVLATAPVRFVVLADDKEIYRSKPRTSLDEPLTASVSIKDAKTLTLKTESTTPHPIPTPGLWGDPSLVK